MHVLQPGSCGVDPPLRKKSIKNPTPHNTLMKILTSFAALAFAATLSLAGEKDPDQCAVCGDGIESAETAEYEGVTYRLCSPDCLKKFRKAREESLYQRLGGKAAIDAAVELFYEKVLADERVSFFFEEINMNAQKRKQKEFLSAALGSPVPWTGKDMREAHKNLDLRESDFAAIAGHLNATLVELGVGEELIAEVMTIVASTKEDVLNR